MKSIDFFEISEEIREAVGKGNTGKPVIALESNLITHGLPLPDNITTAFEMEKNIRDEGAIPATIAIVNGKIKVGLSHDEIEKLAHSEDTVKASTRDLSAILTKKIDAGTTVALTIWVAHRCQIYFFATGGIGGVHRDSGNYAMDVSADLTEISRTPIAVVCSGVKAILDLPRTLEYLETMGVPVLGFQTSEFPAFYSQTSHLRVDYLLRNAQEAAEVIHTHFHLKYNSGMIIANPVPTEFALGKKKMDYWIEKAQEAANKENIKG
ncbi:MAG: pseudouridine-5'-phosphate glycosidase, partial [Candidatus Aminicenantes bacterium]|nr:pseudouridine-5'-phosphate glycosidase [Candidatus Aminicenantes bacterium]